MEVGPTQFIAKIEKVEPIVATALENRAKWKIEVEVESVLTNQPTSPLAPSSHVVFFVHSVSKTFLEDRSNIIGKTYRIQYNAAFANPYFGDVEVSAFRD